MEISWTDRVRNGEVLNRVSEERNIIHRVKRKKADWIGHVLRRNCLLKHVIEGKKGGGIKVTGRKGIRRKQLLNNLKKKKGYCELKNQALDRTRCRTLFGKGYRRVLSQATNEWMFLYIRKKGETFGAEW